MRRRVRRRLQHLRRPPAAGTERTVVEENRWTRMTIWRAGRRSARAGLLRGPDAASMRSREPAPSRGGLAERGRRTGRGHTRMRRDISRGSIADRRAGKRCGNGTWDQLAWKPWVALVLRARSVPTRYAGHLGRARSRRWRHRSGFCRRRRAEMRVVVPSTSGSGSRNARSWASVGAASGAGKALPPRRMSLAPDAAIVASLPIDGRLCLDPTDRFVLTPIRETRDHPGRRDDPPRRASCRLWYHLP